MKYASILFCSCLLFQTTFANNSSLQRAEKLIDTYFHLPSKPEMTLLSGGFSGASNFRIGIGSQQCVLRIYEQNRSLIQTKREFHGLSEGAAIGVAPQIYEIFLEDRAILMDFIPGKTSSIKEAKKEENCYMLAKALQKVHSIERIPFKTPSFHENAEYYYSILLDLIEDKTSLHEAIQVIRHNKNRLANRPKTTIHGDLNPRNIFLTNTCVLLVDWSEISWEDPLYDLADVAFWHAYNPKEEESLFIHYFGRDLTYEEKDVYLLIKRNLFANHFLICQLHLHNLLQKNPDEQIDLDAALKDLETYVEYFAEIEEKLSAQFFYEFGQVALQNARIITASL